MTLSDSAASAPVVGNDETVYVGTKSGLSAIRDGAVVWSTPVTGPVQEVALAKDGIVAVALTAVRTFTYGGTQLKTVTLPFGVTAGPLLLPSSDVVVATADGTVTRLSFSGDQQWAVAASPSATVALAATDDGSIYCANESGGLTKVAADGSVEWQVPVGSGELTALLVTDDGGVLAGTPDGDLIRIAASGNVEWTTNAGAPASGCGEDWSGAFVCPLNVAGSGAVYVDGPTGTISNAYSTIGGGIGSPAIDGGKWFFWTAPLNTLFGQSILNVDDESTFDTKQDAVGPPAIGATGVIYVATPATIFALQP